MSERDPWAESNIETIRFRDGKTATVTARGECWFCHDYWEPTDTYMAHCGRYNVAIDGPSSWRPLRCSQCESEATVIRRQVDCRHCNGTGHVTKEGK